jgi:hypothetical protein
MQPNLKFFCWRDVVFTLTAVAVFPLFQGTQTCYVEVWDRSWLQLREITNVTCSSSDQARSKRVCIAFVVVLCL